MKDQSTLDLENKVEGSEDSDFEDETNDYSNSDMNKILDGKFEGKQRNEKTASKDKKRKN